MQHFHSIIFQDLVRAAATSALRVTERSYPASVARGGGRKEQHHLQGAVAAWAQEGLEELFHVRGQEGQR